MFDFFILFNCLFSNGLYSVKFDGNRKLWNLKDAEGSSGSRSDRNLWNAVSSFNSYLRHGLPNSSDPSLSTPLRKSTSRKGWVSTLHVHIPRAWIGYDILSSILCSGTNICCVREVSLLKEFSMLCSIPVFITSICNTSALLHAEIFQVNNLRMMQDDSFAVV